MALQLMKIVGNALTNVPAHATSKKYFYITPTSISAGTSFAINFSLFRNENGDPVTPPIFIPTNGYANLYINGVLQMDAILSFTASTPTTGSVVITVPGSPDTVILSGSPIILEIVTVDTADTTTTIQT
ncbi:DUF4183 domain-containing protein [Bacillus cereus]|nr:DUF4183 domain-containing protein [Bacillus cereus]